MGQTDDRPGDQNRRLSHCKYVKPAGTARRNQQQLPTCTHYFSSPKWFIKSFPGLEIQWINFQHFLTFQCTIQLTIQFATAVRSPKSITHTQFYFVFISSFISNSYKNSLQMITLRLLKIKRNYKTYNYSIQ